MVFCVNCGHEIKLEARFCGSCGTSIPEEETAQKKPKVKPVIKSDPLPKQNVNSEKVLQRPPEWKSMGVTMVLTIVLGIIGLGGIGHLYLGKIIKGIVLIVVGIILTIFGWLTIVGLIILFIFALYVVYDAYRLCKRYNNDLEQTGRPPW